MWRHLSANTRPVHKMPNGLCVVPHAQARVIFWCSWLAGVNMHLGLFFKEYDLAVAAAALWGSSMLYWWNPLYNWRRWVDIVTVQIAWNYQHSRAYGAEKQAVYFLLSALAIACYPLGVYSHRRGHIWAGTLFHAGIHLLGNVAVFVLYTGKL
jgi:hypothetical protein